MRKVGLILLVILLVVATLIALVGIEVGSYKLGGFLGKEREKMKGEIRTERVEQQNKAFKESTAYIDGMATELSEMWVELDSTENTARRKAIIKKIKRDFAEFDANKLENDELRQFLRDVMSGYIN